jgi:hypothetical protein
VVSREARCGEQGSACTREDGRCQVSGKNAKKKSCTPAEAEGTLNDASRHDAIERRSWYLLWLSPWRRRG